MYCSQFFCFSKFFKWLYRKLLITYVVPICGFLRQCFPKAWGPEQWPLFWCNGIPVIMLQTVLSFPPSLTHPHTTFTLFWLLSPPRYWLFDSWSDFDVGFWTPTLGFNNLPASSYTGSQVFILDLLLPLSLPPTSHCLRWGLLFLSLEPLIWSLGYYPAYPWFSLWRVSQIPYVPWLSVGHFGCRLS